MTKFIITEKGEGVISDYKPNDESDPGKSKDNKFTNLNFEDI